MRHVARYHLYLGCFFAPLIIFYALSGAWQTLNLHRSSKDGLYHPPQILIELSELHKHQRWTLPDGEAVVPRPQDGTAVLGLLPRKAISWLSALMAVCLAATTVLGIVLALQRTRGRRRLMVVGCLAGGGILPFALLVS